MSVLTEKVNIHLGNKLISRYFFVFMVNVLNGLYDKKLFFGGRLRFFL